MNRCARTTVTFVALAAFALPLRPLRAAEPPVVDIRLAESLDEPDYVRAWTERAAKDGLAEAKVDVDEIGARRLVIEVGGKVAAYDFVVGVQQDGKWIGEPTKRHCECGAQELVDRMREDVVAVAPSLRVVAETVPPPVATAEPPAASTPTNQTDRPPARQKMRPLGITGATFIGVGGAMALTGLALVVVGKRDRDGLRAADRGDVNFQRPGIVVLSVGVGAVIAGAVMLGVERSRARRRAQTSWRPSFGGRQAMIVWSGKF